MFSFAILIFIKIFRPQAAGIYVDSRPGSQVYIDNKMVGTTPYRSQKIRSGEISLRLVPQSSDFDFGFYDTKLFLLQNTESVLKIDFGKDDEKTNLELITFEQKEGESGMRIVTLPQGAKITLDKTEGFVSPHIFSEIKAGEHSVEIVHDGYESKKINVKTYDDFQLVLYAELSKSSVVVPPSLETKEPWVEILPTPLGFLRVREEATINSSEVGRVEPGNKYKLIVNDEVEDWLMIEYEEDKKGWITTQYAKILD